MGALADGQSTQHLGNYLQHPRAVLQNIIVPEAKDAPATTLQQFIARMVNISGSVLSAIGFDHKVKLDTCEIDNIGRDRVLPPEAPAKLFMAKFIPKRPFCFRHISAQSLCPPSHR